jgi:hypothetical protein
MGWMGQIGSLLEEYAGGTANPAQTDAHFDKVASAAPTSAIAGALAGAMRSDQTPAFGQLAGQLFGNSSGDQKANVLNELIAAAGPMLPSLLGNSPISGMLSQVLGSGGQITPAQAQQIPPDVVQQIASHAEKQDPSIVDRVSGIYAEHPQLIKTLGSGVLAIALAKFAQAQKA